MTPEQHSLQDTVRRFASTELPSLARELEVRDESLPDAWMKRYAELGVLGINVPEAYGGQGLGHFEAVLALEEFAKISSAWTALPVFEANFGPMAVLVHFASEELKRRLLPRVCRGELVDRRQHVGTRSRHRADRPEDARPRSRRRLGAERYEALVLRAGPCGRLPRLRATFRRARRRRHWRRLRPKGTPGLRFGAREELMGFRGIMTADIFFDDVAVPRENVARLPAVSRS